MTEIRLDDGRKFPEEVATFLSPTFGDLSTEPKVRSSTTVPTEGTVIDLHLKRLEKTEQELWDQLYDTLWIETWGYVGVYGVRDAKSRHLNPRYIEALADLYRARGDMDELARLIVDWGA